MVGVDPVPFEKMACHHREQVGVWASRLAPAWEEQDAWKKRGLVFTKIETRQSKKRILGEALTSAGKFDALIKFGEHPFPYSW